MRLSGASLPHLGPGVERPGYDRAAQQVGIVHFGIGAFHRAHQAWYTDAAMNRGETDWAITGVSLRSPQVAQQMNPQEGLFTIAERSGTGTSLRIVGSVRNVLVASEAPDAVIAAVAAPTTHIVSLTVTEKGYCRTDSGDLDLERADASSFYHLVTQGMLLRRECGHSGLTLLSCDNLADNGGKLRALLLQYLERHQPDLLGWFDAMCTCPATMVDRIVPATTAVDRAMIADVLGGVADDACVVTEPFSQWVIEDKFAGPRPTWEAVGADLVRDVASYETAKLRMLNGVHSLLAYCGLARGYTYVHEAIADPGLRSLAEQLMRGEAAPTITPASNQNLATYADALVHRFANPALNHRLAQIAVDGSQKIPQRWIPVLAANAAMGRSCPAALAGVAAWINHLRGRNGPIDDPRVTELAQAAHSSNPLAALFGSQGPMADIWRPTHNDSANVIDLLS